MNWKDMLKAQGYTDEEIANLQKSFPADKLAKAFEAPMKAFQDAQALQAQVKEQQEAFDARYQSEILPEISKVYKESIAAQTEAAALRARLKAAKDYSFLGADAAISAATGTVPGVTPGAPAARAGTSDGVPGSPDVTELRAELAKLNTAADGIPDMLGRLTKMSNEHFSLFNKPLLDVDELITEAKSKKKNVIDVWNEKYKVAERRKEIATQAQAEHDKKIAEEAVGKYLSEHGTPFTRPATPSIASRFTPSTKEESRAPWKGAGDRKIERRNALQDAINKHRASVAVQ